MTDDTPAALGKLCEALEIVEHARGLLYGFHRLSDSADLTLQDAVGRLRGPNMRISPTRSSAFWSVVMSSMAGGHSRSLRPTTVSTGKHFVTPSSGSAIVPVAPSRTCSRQNSSNASRTASFALDFVMEV